MFFTEFLHQHTLTILISHLMMQLLIRYTNIVLTTTTGHRVRYHLRLILLVHQGGYIVNLSDFYSYRLIGKLTASFQIQEFCQIGHLSYLILTLTHHIRKHLGY